MIARNPKKKDAKASRFIRKADGAGKGKLDIPVFVNFDQDLLDRIESMGKAMGLSRSAFIRNAVAEKLRRLEQKA